MIPRFLGCLALILRISTSLSYAETCPKTSFEWGGFVQFRAQALGNAIAGELSSLSTQPITFYFPCLPQIENEPLACTQNMKTVAENYFKLMAKPGHAMRLKTPDDEYFNQAKPFTQTIPPELIHPEFLNSIRKLSTDVPESIVPLIVILGQINAQKAEAKKWKMLVFEQLPRIPGIDNNAALIYVPAADLPEPSRDLFFLFGLKKNKNSPDPEDLAILAAVHSQPNQPNSRATYLEDFIYRDNRLIHTPMTPDLVQNNTACYTCHTAGGIALHPKKIFASYPENVGETLTAINRAIQSERNKVFTQEFAPMGHALGFGQAQNIEFIKNICLKKRKDLTPEGLEKQAEFLKKRMNCAQCHDGRFRSLIYPPPFGQAPLVGYFVNHGVMPPGRKDGTRVELSPEEERANQEVLKCLDLTSTQTFKDWIAERGCL